MSLQAESERAMGEGGSEARGRPHFFQPLVPGRR